MPKFCDLLKENTFLSTNLSTVKVDKDLKRITIMIRVYYVNAIKFPGSNSLRYELPGNYRILLEY